jgi:hypothetical protein
MPTRPRPKRATRESTVTTNCEPSWRRLSVQESLERTAKARGNDRQT